MDNQQQPNPFQWPQQDFQYQPPGPQHPQMPHDGQSMPMPGPTQSTPDLNTMYSQHPQMGQQSAQQGFAPQPHVQYPQQQMPLDQALPPQQQQYQGLLAGQGALGGQPPQQASYDAFTAANPYTQTQQQYPQQPLINPQSIPQYQVPPPHTPYPPHPTSQTASLYNNDPTAPASAWEQQNITEVNPTQPQPHPQPQHQNPPPATARAHALQSALSRIQILETDLERRETAAALALSATQSSPQQQEQDAQDLHEALLASLDSYEQDLRRQMELQGQGPGAYEQQPYYAPSTLRPAAISSPAASEPGSARSGTSRISRPAPPLPGQSSRRPARSEASWRSPTPRPYTPTRGTTVEAAARNRAVEEGRRWAGFERVRRDGGGGETEGSVYTVGEGEAERVGRGASKG